MSSVEEARFKVGQKVRLVKQFTDDPGWIEDDMARVLASGEVGEVTSVGLYVEVQFPSILPRFIYPAFSLAPADAPRAPKVGDKVRVKHGSVTQPKYYGKIGEVVGVWAPKQGEVGQDKDGDFFLVTDENEDDSPPLIVYLTGPVGEVGTVDPQDGDVLVYPTLKAAIEAGF